MRRQLSAFREGLSSMDLVDLLVGCYCLQRMPECKTFRVTDRLI
jgi:hypothetical protein